jgi:hypothetical protein
MNTLRLRAPSDILAAIPYVIGYRPERSIVVLGMHERRLIFSVRHDLPSAGDLPGSGAGTVGDAEVHQHVDRLLELLLRQHLTDVVLVGFGDVDQVDAVLHGVWDACERADLGVREVLRTDGGRYWSYLCRNPRCCPPEGVPYEPDSSTMAAEWTLAGRVARRDRAEFDDQLEPTTGPERDAMTAAMAAGQARLIALLAAPADEAGAAAAMRAAGCAAVGEAIERQRAGTRLTDDEVVWLSLLLMDGDVRDHAWYAVRTAGLDLDHHCALWTDVVRRCESDLRPAAACLLAYAAWREGNGALARLALERALDANPDWGHARTLFDALTQGMPPWVLDQIADEIVSQGDEAGDAEGDDAEVDDAEVDDDQDDENLADEAAQLGADRRVAPRSRVRPRRARRPRRRSSSGRAGSRRA